MNRNIAIMVTVGVLILGGSIMGGTKLVTAEENATVKAVDVGNKICPVSGEKIDAASGMAPATYEHNGKIYNFCCPGCISTFKVDPEKYGKIAEDEVALQQAK